MKTMLVLGRSLRPEAMVDMVTNMVKSAAGTLSVLCCFEGHPIQSAAPVTVEQVISGPGLLRTVRTLLDRIGAGGVELLSLRSPDRVAAVLEAIAGRTVDLVVLEHDGRAPADVAPDAELVDRLFRFAPCDALLLDPAAGHGHGIQRVLVPMDTSLVASALAFAVKISEKPVPVVPLLVGHEFGADSRVIARKELEQKLRGVGIPVSDRFVPDVMVAKKPLEGLVRAVRGGDLMLIPASSDQVLRKFRTAQSVITAEREKDCSVGILRPLREDGFRTLFPRLMTHVPRLNAPERVRVFDQLLQGARFNPDFLMMMGMATAIAALGLLQDSGAVVIGAMLVAPLMSPLIGAGYALIQGNIRLFQESLKSLAYGIAFGLGLSIIIGLASPAGDLTREIMARTTPGAYDLLVAYFSGLAAAYAFARPGLAGTLAGVAIAAALVPPLATVGIGISRGFWGVAGGAAVLHLTNLVAITLGAASAFRLLGVKGVRLGIGPALWARRVILILALFAVTLSVPLGMQSAKAVHEGQNRPMAYPLSSVLYSALKDRIDQELGVDIIMAGRSSFTEKGISIAMLLDSDGPISATLKMDLQQIVKESVGAEATVRVYVLQKAAIKMD
ncbi:MAG: DUF389 domain-containing protein [Pseudomonadota bacterium]